MNEKCLCSTVPPETSERVTLKLEMNSVGLSVQIVENQNHCCFLHKKKKSHLTITFELSNLRAL